MPNTIPVYGNHIQYYGLEELYRTHLNFDYSRWTLKPTPRKEDIEKINLSIKGKFEDMCIDNSRLINKSLYDIYVENLFIETIIDQEDLYYEYV